MIVVCVLLSILANPANSTNFQSIAAESKTKECVAKIVQEVFPNNSTIHVLSDSGFNTIDLLKNIFNPVLLTTTDSLRSKTLNFYNNYIFYLNNERNLSATMDSFIKSNVWHPRHSLRGKYLIITHFTKQIHSVFQFLGKRNVRNIIMIILNQDFNIFPSLYVWLPFHPRNECGKHFIISRHHNNCNHEIAKSAFTINMTSLSRCTVQVHATLNYSNPMFNVYSAPPVKIIENSIYLMQDILKSKLEIVLDQKRDINNFSDFIMIAPLLFIDTDNFDMSNGLYYDTRVWIVPRAGKISNLWVIYSIFKTEVWFTILAFIFLTSMVWYAVAIRIGNEQNVYNQFTICVLSTFSLMSSVALNLPPKSGVLQMFMVFYLFFTLHIDNAFQSKLSSILLKPSYEPPISTIQKLLDSKLTLCVNKYFAETLRNENNFNNSVVTDVLKKLVVLDSLNAAEYIKRVAYDRNHSSIFDKHIISKLYTKEIKLMNVIEEGSKLPRLHIAMAMKKGHYFLDIFNKIISRILEGGFNDHLLSGSSKRQTYESNSESDDMVTMNIEHLYSIFIIWLAGLFLAFTVFLVEIIWNKYHSMHFYF